MTAARVPVQPVMPAPTAANESTAGRRTVVPSSFVIRRARHVRGRGTAAAVVVLYVVTGGWREYSRFVGCSFSCFVIYRPSDSVKLIYVHLSTWDVEKAVLLLLFNCDLYGTDGNLMLLNTYRYSCDNLD